MGLPEQELFTIKDVAARLGKPESYVEELVRKREFNYIILEDTLKSGPLTRHLYFDRAIWPYGKRDYENIGPCEVANFWAPNDFAKNYTWPRNLAGVSIPRTAVKAFETKYKIISGKRTSVPAGAIPNKNSYTVQEAATRAGVHVSTIRRWIADRKLKATRTVGQHRRISRDDLQPFISRSAD